MNDPGTAQTGPAPVPATVLVAGATGMTGRHLVEQLLANYHHVIAIVRSPHKFAARVLQHPQMTIVEANILDLTNEELTAHVKNCDAVISCLGHVLSFKGMFGEPRRLCTDAARRLCGAVENSNPGSAIKFILMNTVGVGNPDLDEKRTWFEQGLLGVLRHTIPPHRDNETAATFLHETVGIENPYIEWCSVRPDSLTNDERSPYDVEASPVTGILSGRPTARSNVAHFMCRLIEDEALWHKWKFKMPVIMNAGQEGNP